MVLHVGVELAFDPTERCGDLVVVFVVVFLGTVDQCDEDAEAARDEGDDDAGLHVTGRGLRGMGRWTAG